MYNLGLIGAPGAGKDSIANFLENDANYNRFAFADKIKEEYYKISNHTEEQFKSHRNSGIELEIRKELWAYSDKMKSRFGETYFIDPVVQEVEKSTKPSVITDVRTFKELCVLESIGIKFFIIIRDHKKELSGRILPGTKLALNRIIGFYPIFWNDSLTVEETLKKLRIFLKEHFNG